jgi:hypothetical protein
MRGPGRPSGVGDRLHTGSGGRGRPARGDPDVRHHHDRPLALGDWLQSFGVTLVGMESTGIHWRPVFYLLEDHFECWLLNGEHLHNVPGRKTDVADAAWICQLIEHGLVCPSFVPPKPIRELRDLTPYRKALIEERGPPGPAAAHGAGERRDQAVLGGLPSSGGLRPSHDRGVGPGDAGP